MYILNLIQALKIKVSLILNDVEIHRQVFVGIYAEFQGSSFILSYFSSNCTWIERLHSEAFIWQLWPVQHYWGTYSHKKSSDSLWCAPSKSSEESAKSLCNSNEQILWEAETQAQAFSTKHGNSSDNPHSPNNPLPPGYSFRMGHPLTCRKMRQPLRQNDSDLQSGSYFKVKWVSIYRTHSMQYYKGVTISFIYLLTKQT